MAILYRDIQILGPISTYKTSQHQPLSRRSHACMHASPRLAGGPSPCVEEI